MTRWPLPEPMKRALALAHEAAEAGEVRWGGRRIAVQGEDFRRGLAYLGHANGLKEDLTAVENLRQSMALMDVAVDAAAVRAELAAQGLDAVADLPVRLLGQLWVVRHHENRSARSINREQQIHDLVRHCGIEITGGLIRQD